MIAEKFSGKQKDDVKKVSYIFSIFQFQAPPMEKVNKQNQEARELVPVVSFTPSHTWKRTH